MPKPICWFGAATNFAKNSTTAGDVPGVYVLLDLAVLPFNEARPPLTVTVPFELQLVVERIVPRNGSKNPGVVGVSVTSASSAAVPSNAKAVQPSRSPARQSDNVAAVE